MINKLMYNHNCYQMLAALAGGGRLPHTVIISGRAGSGKKTFANQLAAAYFCSDTNAGNRPCGVCLDCRLVLCGTHPDLETVEGTSKSGAISVDTVRQVKLKSQIKPNQSERRGFILKDCHLMLGAAQNALLKQIEDPVNGVFYILITENSNALLETIRSRAVTFIMSELTIEQCAEVVLSAMPNVDKDYAKTVSALCGASVGMTLGAIADTSNEAFYKDCSGIANAINSRNLYEILTILVKYEGNRQKYLSLLNSLKLMLVSSSKSSSSSLISSQIVEISDILDYAVAACTQNVVLSLLSTVLAGKIIEV